MTVDEIVRSFFDNQRAKHGSHLPDGATGVNRMSNAELLEAISDAIEERLRVANRPRCNCAYTTSPTMEFRHYTDCPIHGATVSSLEQRSEK